MNLGVGNNHNQVGMPSSSVSWKSGEVSDKFPAGLRVLVVDDDPTCLMILEKMLRNCLYEVTKCNRAEVALSLLRENRKGFDIVISDVHMPDMDGFKLLEDIGLEMDLPVIMMSADDSKHVVMKGVTHGACDYLIKPVRIEALRNIWQHVIRKKKYEWKDFEPSSACVDDGERPQKVTEDADYSSSANEGSWKNTKRRKDEDDEGEERDDSSSLKKPRVVWSVELHQQFVAAVNQLGIDKAVPKKILELMNVPGLTRENVASHLQKYRLYLKRLSGTQLPGGLNAPFMGPTDPGFAAMSSLSGLDLQALAASGQLPVQSLATLQAAALGRSSAKPHLSDQRNLFSFENPKYRYGEGQQQLLNNNNKQMNLLHGIPTNMEAKQLAGLHQTTHSFGGMTNQVNAHGSHNGPVLIPMGHQPQSRQPILSSGLGSGVLAQNGMVNNLREAVFSPISQSSSSLVDFSVNQKTVDNVFPIGASSITGISPLQDDANLDMKGPRGVIPGYDVFNDLNQAKAQDSWGLPNAGLSFSSSQNVNMQSLIHSQNHVSSSFGKPMFSAGEEIVNQNRMNIPQHPHNTFIGENQLRVKPERLVGGHSNMFHEQYGGHDDLISVVLKQQQEGIGQVDNEFTYDGYPLDNLPV